MNETCEICGKPATVSVQDIRETDPHQDAKGKLWRTWECDGDPHHFCPEHVRLSKQTFQQTKRRQEFQCQ